MRATIAVRLWGALGRVDGLTVTTKLVVAVSAPSLALSVMVDAPSTPTLVTATVRFSPAPPRETFVVGMTAGFDEVAVTFTAAPSGSLTVNAIGPVDPAPPATKSVRSAGTVPNAGG